MRQLQDAESGRRSPGKARFAAAAGWGEAALGDAPAAVAAELWALSSLGCNRSQGFSGLSQQDCDHALA